MVLPFEHTNLLHSRYDVIARPGSAFELRRPPKIDLELPTNKSAAEYASFLKEKERKVGPEGFLDSHRYTHTFEVKELSPRVKTSPRRASSVETVVDLQAKIKKDQKDYEKRMKVVEDHMWQHKQAERELKRVEGDVLKKQRHVKRVIRDLENSIQKKTLEEDKKLNKTLQTQEQLQRDYVHQTEEKTKEHISQSAEYMQQFKDKTRKALLHESDAERQYKAKQAAMELVRTELERMNLEFTQKMQQKEEEQFKLKKELADLAIKLNMDAQKKRQMQFEQGRIGSETTRKRILANREADTTLEASLGKSEGGTRRFETGKRLLSAELNTTRSHLQERARDEARRLRDSLNLLEKNADVQRKLQEEAQQADLDLRSKQIDQKLQAHSLRKQQRLNALVRTKAVERHEKLNEWEERYLMRVDDDRRRKHEDKMKHFKVHLALYVQRVVGKGYKLDAIHCTCNVTLYNCCAAKFTVITGANSLVPDFQRAVGKAQQQEHSMYEKVRQSEYSRTKQEQVVKKMQDQLSKLKKKNSSTIREQMADSLQKEKELEYKLQREKAQLMKTTVDRETMYENIVKLRERLREDKYVMGEEEREHMRLQRIGMRTDGYLDQGHTLTSFG
ncbi:PREDICTED: trichohyalin-like [Branchiostoma belcheri]|uniref:Trichohyalin-like n=1 Tax=Branchiostoma belcheri TaxID=7741 RepID=A0A6P5A7V8_BRABE|nr:PREDICTED: trichohyalin-like [Branchiostoma belcheri]